MNMMDRRATDNDVLDWLTKEYLLLVRVYKTTWLHTSILHVSSFRHGVLIWQVGRPVSVLVEDWKNFDPYSFSSPDLLLLPFLIPPPSSDQLDRRVQSQGYFIWQLSDIVPIGYKHIAVPIR